MLGLLRFSTTFCTKPIKMKSKHNRNFVFIQILYFLDGINYTYNAIYLGNNTKRTSRLVTFTFKANNSLLAIVYCPQHYTSLFSFTYLHLPNSFTVQHNPWLVYSKLESLTQILLFFFASDF